MRAKGREGRIMDAYHCPVCQHFHVGQRQMRKSAKPKVSEFD